MSQAKRYQTRSDIPVDDLGEEREEALRTAFENAIYGERIQHCVAATFELGEPIEKEPVVISSRLDHERMFEPVSSFAGSKDDEEREHFASAHVKDVETGDELAAHITEDRILVSLRDEDVSFESFAAYVLYLEQRLDVELTAVLDE